MVDPYELPPAGDLLPDPAEDHLSDDYQKGYDEGFRAGYDQALADLKRQKEDA